MGRPKKEDKKKPMGLRCSEQEKANVNLLLCYMRKAKLHITPEMLTKIFEKIKG